MINNAGSPFMLFYQPKFEEEELLDSFETEDLFDENNHTEEWKCDTNELNHPTPFYTPCLEEKQIEETTPCMTLKQLEEFLLSDISLSGSGWIVNEQALALNEILNNERDASAQSNVVHDNLGNQAIAFSQNKLKRKREDENASIVQPHRRWFVEQEEKLLSLVRRNLSWTKISTQLPGKSAKACSNYFARNWKLSSIVNHPLFVSNQPIVIKILGAFNYIIQADQTTLEKYKVKIEGEQKVLKWSEEDDKELLTLINAHKNSAGRIDWKRLYQNSSFKENRTLTVCQERHQQIKDGKKIPPSFL